jgi:hypothetical protein
MNSPFRLNHDQGRNENAPAGTGANYVRQPGEGL